MPVLACILIQHTCNRCDRLLAMRHLNCWLKSVGLASCRLVMTRTSHDQQVPKSRAPLMRCRARTRARATLVVTLQRTLVDPSPTMARLTLKSKLAALPLCCNIHEHLWLLLSSLQSVVHITARLCSHDVAQIAAVKKHADR